MSKTIYVFGGPNGVGKSTIGYLFGDDNSIDFINPDQINLDQKQLHKVALSKLELFNVLDTYITNALQTEDVVIIENNLHEENSYRFILSYCNKFRAKSICRFFYLDDVNELIRRVKNRVKHLGHAVSDETVYKRYKSSIELIVENINSFDEIHFYDVSKENAEAVKVFEVFDGKLN